MEEQYSSAETMEEQPAQRQPPALERGLSIKSREPREPLTNITGGDQAPKKGGLVLHPHSRFKICWDIISTLALIYNIVVVPYRIAFDSHVYCPNSVWILEAVIDWFFVADILLHFFTGYISSSGSIVTSYRAIAVNYAKTWMLVDVASSAPIDFFMSLALDGCVGKPAATDGGQVSALKLMCILRLVKLFKLLRLLKLSSLLEDLQDEFPVPMGLTVVSKAGGLVCLTFYIGHLTGCVFYAVGAASRAAGEPSWLDGVSSLDDSLPGGPNLEEAYIAALYWAFTTMTTVGYGDFSPVSAGERIFTIFAMMVGCAVFGYIIGSTTSLVASADAASAQLAERISNLNMYMKDRKLPRELQVGIRKYFKYFWSRRTVFTGEEEILQDLSKPLRAKLLRFMHRDVLEQMPLFEVCDDPGFIDILVRAMKPLFASPSDSIVVEGTQGDEMFVLTRGRVEVLHAGSREEGHVKVGELLPGSYFGEIALLDQTIRGVPKNRRLATVKAVEFCELRSVAKEHLTHCFEEFPEVHRSVMALVNVRIARLLELNEAEDCRSNTSGGATSLFRSRADRAAANAANAANAVANAAGSGGHGGHASSNLHVFVSEARTRKNNLSAAISTVQKLRDLGDTDPALLVGAGSLGFDFGRENGAAADEEEGGSGDSAEDAEARLKDVDAMLADLDARSEGGGGGAKRTALALKQVEQAMRALRRAIAHDQLSENSATMSPNIARSASPVAGLSPSAKARARDASKRPKASTSIGWSPFSFNG